MTDGKACHELAVTEGVGGISINRELACYEPQVNMTKQLRRGRPVIKNRGAVMTHETHEVAIAEGWTLISNAGGASLSIGKQVSRDMKKYVGVE